VVRHHEAVSSRFLVGLGAWLLGAVTATTGSMIAVNELAHGLLGPQTQQVGGATVSADLDAGAGSPSPSLAAVAGPSPGSTRAPKIRHSSSPAASASGVAAQDPAGTLLVSGDGSVMATCQSGGAYLLYWSPDQGFQADDVYRGPAAVATVTFRGPTASASVVMRVTCPAGTPVAHVYQPSADDRTGSDDGTGH
jgi:hypothetical protein